MAVLAPPIIPLYLYRYRSLGEDGSFLDRELKALKEAYIWCSTFKRLNSPSALLKSKDEYREIARAIYDSKTNIGIAALSDTYDNELMWTHYADEYRGICVEYYADRLFNQLPRNCTLSRVGYVNEPTRVSAAYRNSFEEAAIRILSQKKSSWAYEREWRVLGPVGRVNIRGMQPVVRSLRLGSRMGVGIKDEILQAFKGTDVDVYEMIIDGYEHGWARIQDAAKRRKTAKKASKGSGGAR